ncbi:MAG: DUF2281 domain-containing protein [Deltaproteobacteria bacterium]|nr:DUF2281 domain-containing protein [Deltaproteobacteria bacterium]
MNPIAAEAVITGDHKLSLNTDLPKDCPVGKAKAAVTVEPQQDAPAPANRLAELRGQGKGKVWMSDDFDEPLEDFAEHM